MFSAVSIPVDRWVSDIGKAVNMVDVVDVVDMVDMAA